MRFVHANDTMVVSVANNSVHAVRATGQMLDASRDNELRIEVATDEKIPIEQCRGIDYIGTSDIREIAPGESEEFSLPLSAVAIAFCLGASESYLARAVMPEGIQASVQDPIVSSWVSFSPPNIPRVD